jgi:hypothetical protein
VHEATLTLEEDVAVQIERLRRARDASLKDIVNDALRLGLREMLDVPRKRKQIRTQAFHMGEPLINIDNVAEALAYLESDGFK